MAGHFMGQLLFCQVIGHCVQFQVKTVFIAVATNLAQSLSPLFTGAGFKRCEIRALGVCQQNMEMAMKSIYTYGSFKAFKLGLPKQPNFL